MSGRVLAIVGPTAVGKSAVAVQVGKELTGEIIALDSRQVYRNMSIGTVQPAERDREGIPHHLYGILKPDHPISAGEYARLAEAKIDEILEKGKEPIICGGSGLYFRALTQGLFEGSTSDSSVREKLQRELNKRGSSELLKRLRKIDPEYAEIVHPNNHKRLLRALEIYETTGVPPSEHFRRHERKSSRHDFFSVYLKVSARELDDRIRKRTEKMLNAGWIEETKRLLASGYSRDSHPMDSLGYGQIIAYLENRIDFDRMVDLIHNKTRQYARKQVKWFDREHIDLCLGPDVVLGKDKKTIARMVVREFKKGLMREG